MISIIIPAFNEEKRLSTSLDKLISFLRDFNQETEVIVVDDGSSDKTLPIAESFGGKIKNFSVLHFEDHHGKGWAVKQGFLKASGDILFFTDADFSTPISEMTKLTEAIDQGFDIAIGSRTINPSLVKRQQNFGRKLMGRSFNLLVQLLAFRGTSDTQCGFKAFKASTTKKIFEKQAIYDFGFDVELLFLARKNNLRVVEIPVLWYNTPGSNINPFKDSILMFYDLFKIRLTHAADKKSWLDKTLDQISKRTTLAKFALVGAFGAIVDYSSFFFLTRSLHFSPLSANPLSVELSVLSNFTLNNLWTFSSRDNQKHVINKFASFQFVSFGGLLVSQIQILVYIHLFHINDIFSKVLTIPLVALFNYFVNSHWTFKNQKEQRTEARIFFLLIIGLFVLYLILVKSLTGSFQLLTAR